MSGKRYISRRGRSSEKEFSISIYLLSEVIGNRYLSRSSEENAINITVSRYVIYLLTIPFLNLFIIHWIQEVQWNAFRENFIGIVKKTWWNDFLLGITISHLIWWTGWKINSLIHWIQRKWFSENFHIQHFLKCHVTYWTNEATKRDSLLCIIFIRLL